MGVRRLQNRAGDRAHLSYAYTSIPHKNRFQTLGVSPTLSKKAYYHSILTPSIVRCKNSRNVNLMRSADRVSGNYLGRMGKKTPALLGQAPPSLIDGYHQEGRPSR